MNHHGEPRALRRQIAVARVVDAAKIDQLLETELIAQLQLRRLRVLHFDGELAAVFSWRKAGSDQRIVELLQPGGHRDRLSEISIERSYWCAWSCSVAARCPRD